MAGTRIDNKKVNFTEEQSSFLWDPEKTAGTAGVRKYAAALLISDGHLNSGRSPLDMSWSRNLPIYPLLPLAAREHRSLTIQNASYHWKDTQQDLLTLQLDIQQAGLTGQTARFVVVNKFEQELANRQFVFTSALVRQTIDLVIAQDEQLTIFLELPAGEYKAKTSLFVAKQRPLKQVLIISERVNALQKMLVTLLPDSLYRRVEIIGTLSGKTGLQSLPDKAARYDLVILNQPGKAVAEGGLRELVKRQLAEMVPLILFNDGSERLSPGWAQLLSLQTVPGGQPGTEQVVRWATDARNHPWYLSLLGTGLQPAALLNFPPLATGDFVWQHAGKVLIKSGRDAQSYPVLILNNQTLYI
jgi:hypothetical protein